MRIPKYKKTNFDKIHTQMLGNIKKIAIFAF